MKKAQYRFRGPVPQDVIEAVEFELGPPGAGQVLIEVRSLGRPNQPVRCTDADWRVRHIAGTTGGWRYGGCW